MPSKSTQSTETQLRHAKATIREANQSILSLRGVTSALRVEIKRLRETGSMMANVCYNLGQDGNSEGAKLESHTRGIMTDLRKSWDAIERNK